MRLQGTDHLVTEARVHGEFAETGDLPTDVATRQSIMQTREAMRVPGNGKMLLSVMWAFHRELELFRAKPRAAHVDFTANTNAEKRLPCTQSFTFT